MSCIVQDKSDVTSLTIELIIMEAKYKQTRDVRELTKQFINYIGTNQPITQYSIPEINRKAEELAKSFFLNGLYPFGPLVTYRKLRTCVS